MHGIHQSQEGKNEYFLSIVLFDLRYLCEQDLIQEYSARELLETSSILGSRTESNGVCTWAGTWIVVIEEYWGTPGAHLENSCRRTILHPSQLVNPN